jgi:hypothetical protein
MDSMEQDLGSRQVLFEELDQMAEDVPGSSASMSAADESQEPTKAEGVEAECQTDIEGFLLRGLVSIHRFKSSPEAVKLFTGFSDFNHFLYLYQCLGPAAEHLTYKSQSLDAKDELFLCLMKLRMNKDDVELGILFGISKSTAVAMLPGPRLSAGTGAPLYILPGFLNVCSCSVQDFTTDRSPPATKCTKIKSIDTMCLQVA